MKHTNRPNPFPFKKTPLLTDPEKPSKKSPIPLSPKQKTSTPKHVLVTEPQSRPSEPNANSPIYIKKTINSMPSSPLQRCTPNIEKILRKSLKKFKKEKIELEKIKKFAETWQACRKKKLDKYNQQTRLDNKKFQSKNPRAKTALGSPETKENFLETDRRPKKRAFGSSLERRANIGLEFYQMRNLTPRVFASEKNEERVVKKPEKNKKNIENFIKKKRKERTRQEQVLKEQEIKNENKRIKELMKIETRAKNLLKKSTKGRPPRPKNVVPKGIKIPENRNITNSQDHEVQLILKNKDFNLFESQDKEGRECLMFKISSNDLTDSQKESSESQQFGSKRPRSQELFKVISSSMPIVELKSISNNSSSEKSVANRQRNKETEIECDINKDIGVHKLLHFVLNKIQRVFLEVKFSDPTVIETPQLSELPNLNPSPEKSLQKGPLEAILSQISKKQSREPSEDIEKIWDKIEFNSKTVSYLNDPEPLPPLTPIEDCQKSSKHGSKKPSEEISASIFDQLKRVAFPSIEILSFGNIEEISHEEIIESPSLMSINSHASSEPSEVLTTFGPINSPLSPVLTQPEPAKALFLSVKIANPILIDDYSGSLSDYLAIAKENSSIATPEAEEVEEFSSINFEINTRQPGTSETSMNPFSLSEETLLLDEEEIIEKTMILLEIFVYQDLIDLELYEEYRKKNFQLLGNAVVVLHEVFVRTGVGSVLSFVEKLWKKADKNEVFTKIFDWQVHFAKLGAIQGRNDRSFRIITEQVLELAEEPEFDSFSLSSSESPNEFVKAHNRMVFDCLNFLLAGLQKNINPAPWNITRIAVKEIDVEFVVQDVSERLKALGRVCAGRIPGIAMIGNNGVLDEEMLQKVRENGLTEMLAGDVFEEEKMWTDYGVEESQFVFDLADFILYDMLVEFKEILY